MKILVKNDQLHYLFLVVKRGCAKKDPQYRHKNGCEEQLTGKGNFALILCLCEDNLCNFAFTAYSNMSLLIIALIVNKILTA